jgi:hypothetical protein
MRSSTSAPAPGNSAEYGEFPDSKDNDVGETAMQTVRRRSGAEQTMTHDQVAVARLLSESGPIAGADAAEALGWTRERWWHAVGNATALFDVTGKGWVLTHAARVA